MEPQDPIPLGKRVRLTGNFVRSGMSVIKVGSLRQKPTIPAGTEGTVHLGSSCFRSYVYDVKCPVNWKVKHQDVARPSWTPWELFEFVD